MIISLLVAVDHKLGIGKNGRLPWHLRTDLMNFKRLTLGHHILMGRKTYEAIGRALPGRVNLILTRHEGYQAAGGVIVSSLEEAIGYAKGKGEEELFVIGGGEIFAEAFPFADRIYLTRVDVDAGCDTFFPHFDLNDWTIIETRAYPADDNNDFPFDIITLSRKEKLNQAV